MPQLFQVVRCYKCLVFQVHQIKKSNKWECKMCGEKQSVKRHYGLGTAKDCRLHVQKLNGIRGQVDQLKHNEIDTDDENANVQSTVTVQETPLRKESRWANYVEEIVPPAIDSTSSMYLNDKEVVLELPQKSKIILGNHCKNKIMKSNDEIDEVPQRCVREASLCSPDISVIQKSELNLNNIRNTIVKSNDHSETIDSIKQNDKNGKYLHNSHSCKPAPTLSVESSYSSVKYDFNASKQVVNKFKPPAINKNSKWAQFANEEEQEELPEDIENLSSPSGEQFWGEPEKYESPGEEIENPVASYKEQSQNKSHALFALCDDVDLDDVLDL